VRALFQQLSIELDFFVRETLIWAVVRMGKKAVAPSIEMLQRDNPQARLLAAQALGKIGDVQAVSALSAAVQDPDIEVARRAIYALGQIGDASAIPALLGLLGEQRGDLRSTVTTSLEQLGKENVALFAQALVNQHWQVREQVADILGLIGNPQATPGLVQAFKDQDPRVRFAVIAALGHINDPMATPTITLAANDTDFRVRTLATKLIQR
jgi:HEAT repeats/PBS lyase HEAT-like repeat